MLLASIAQVPGGEAAKADFFDVIARSPAEVAVAFPDRQIFEDMEQLLYGFVGLPMSEDHRKEFIASLQAACKSPQPESSSARLCLLNLLEEDARCDEALATLRSGPHESLDDGIREIRLLWLAGKETEAGELAARLAGLRTGVEGWHSPVQIDLIKNHVDRALKFLTFLENQSAVPPEMRYGLVLQHLELARRQGDATRLIEESRPPLLRAVWNAAMGKKDQALADLAAADSITRPGGLELLLIALGPEPPVVERAKTLLATAKLTAGQRTSLLKGFNKASQRFELWAGMPAGHGETAASLGLTEVDPFDTFNPFDTFEPFYPFATNDPFATDSPAAKPPEYRRICLDILAAHPADARLQLLVALLSVNEPDRGKPFLLQAATAVRKNPEADSGFADPAASALRWLVPLSEAAELDQLLMAAPGFTQLPAEDRIRYQMAAGLDTRVVASFAACQFDQPSQDALSGRLADYFIHCARDRAIPAETLAMLLDRLPELVCGSMARDSSEIADLAREWIDFLASEALPEQRLVEAVNRLVAAAAQRSPEVHRSVLSTLPETIWTLRGLEFSRPEITPMRRPDIPEWWSSLAIFVPPNPVYDASITNWHPPGMFDTPMNGQPFTPNQIPGVFALLCSRWEQNMAASLDLYPADPKAKVALAAKLRPLFDDTHPRATIYDLLVATGALPCPDPAMKALAERRLAVLTATPQADPAIAIYLFLQRLDHNEPLDQALTALQGLQGLPNLPPSARMRLEFAANVAMERLSQFPGSAEAFMKQLGFIEPAKP